MRMNGTLFVALSMIGAVGFIGASQELRAQDIRIGPGGIRIGPERHEQPRDEIRHRLHELREACESGNRHACVRFGIIIGENKERVADWRRDDPELFFYERER